MEKFSTWRDKGTGISPFMPVENPKTLTKKLLNPLLLAFKLPVFFLLYSISFIAPKPVVKLILSLFGVSEIDVLVEGVRKVKTDEINKKKPAQNEVVVANFISPLDILLLFCISNVTSVSNIAVVIPGNGSLYQFSVWQFVLVSFSPLEEFLAEGTKLDNYTSLQGKLVVLYPEGTPSNNRAVLPFEKIPQSFFEMPKFSYKTVVLRMYPNNLTLPVPHLTKFQYLCKALTLGNSLIKMKIVPLEKAYSLTLAKLVFAENGLSIVDLGLTEKTKFYTYYKGYALADVTK